MKLYPYDLPRLPDFKSRSFKNATQRWAPLIHTLIKKHRLLRKGGGCWVFSPVAHRAGLAREKPWLAKAYVCIAPRHYWPCVARCIREFGDRSPWKFYLFPKGYERPDKIVFYAGSRRDLRRVVSRLRNILRGFSFHEIRHSATAYQLGLENQSRGGIYVGTDPRFLGQAWRMYRTLCFAWASINKDYFKTLPGGEARWFERMNLSIEHEGPRSLEPDEADIPYIRRYWRLINETR